MRKGKRGQLSMQLVGGALCLCLLVPWVLGGLVGFGAVSVWISYVYPDMEEKEAEAAEEVDPPVYGPGIQDIIDALDRGEFGIIPEEPLTKEEQEARDQYLPPKQVDV